MRILVFNADYENFLRVHYRDNPTLASASYAAQMAARNESLFAVADFYSRNFRAHGHSAAEIHVNNPFLQGAWAREHGLDIVPPPLTLDDGPRTARLAGIKRLLKPVKPLLKPFLSGHGKKFLDGGMAEILRAQIADFRPDVILNQELDFIRPAFFEGILPSGCRLVGQIGSELPQDEDFRAYDLVITSLPDFVTWFRARGVHAELNLLAFEASVLDAIAPRPQDIPVSFVGSLMSVHQERIELLEHVARHVPLAVWGNGIERLSPASPLRAAHRGVAWGREMYDILRRSRISLNQHGFIALVHDTANNMRLYEATGMGSLLLTDAKSNLGSMFDPGREVVTYASPDECVAKIRHYLAHEPERAAIAAAGQRRTLADHNYFTRTGEILDLIARLPARS